MVEGAWDLMGCGHRMEEGEVTVTCDTHSRVASKYRYMDFGSPV